MAFQPGVSGQATLPSAKRSKWKTVGIPAVAAVVGMAMGAGAGSSGAQTELEELRGTERQLSQNVATLTDTGKRVVAQFEKLETERDAIATVVDDRDAQVSELTVQVETLQARVSELEQQVTAAQAAATQAAAPQPLPFATQQAAPQPAPASAYYENCTAARNAGAAPVWAGDPGYGKHLDRDGDGVGCE